MKLGQNITLLCIFILQLKGNVTAKEREKRFLLFTDETQFGTFVTISIPLHPETTVSVAWFFEANYYNVDNSSYFDPLLGGIDTVSRNRQERSPIDSKNILSRRNFYDVIESMLEKHDFPGRPCLLLAICENVNSFFLHNGLQGDLLHLVLTPSITMSEEDLEDEYFEAEYLGHEEYCDPYFVDCPTNPIDLISIHVEHI